MFLVDQLILLGGLLLLAGILSSKFSVRLGLPVLVLFLVVGMLAGEEGPGGIQFDDVSVAHAIGSLALAMILFDGGFQTQASALREVWKPSLLLATVGVFVTAIVTGAAAAFILGVPLLAGILLGSIASSTDAAAVFAILRSAGVRLRPRVASTLEVESASNDPMAIFLTVGFIEVALGQMELGFELLGLFVRQMGIGTLAGLGVGWLSVKLMNRINLDTAGLYPALAGTCGLLSYGTAAALGGSGFLAIYLAGIVLGNNRTTFQRGTAVFLDGLAWLSQVTMFVMLGLLVTPSEVFSVAGPGLLVAAAQILIARPLAVVPALLPFRYSLREHVLISWVGLKGAVPIILSVYPLLYGVENGALLFNVVFFVVLISATLQGWTLPIFAERLGLDVPEKETPAATLEIVSMRDVDADIVEYTVGKGSRAAGKTLSELALPDGVVVAMIARANTLIPPRGSTVIAAGDHIFVVMRPAARSVTDSVFSSGPAAT